MLTAHLPLIAEIYGAEAAGDPLMLAFVAGTAFLFGAVIGSFLNVCISRLPVISIVQQYNAGDDALRAEIDGFENQVARAIYETAESFHLLPAQPELSMTELALINTLSRERVLLTILEPVLPRYDFVLIDCNPSLGLLVVNALTAASSVIIPIQAEYLAARGALMILSSIETVRRKKLNPDLEIAGILLTMADTRTILAQDVHDAITTQYGDDILIFDTIIKRSIRFAESAAAGQSILAYDPKSQGAEAYRQVAKALLM